MKHIVLSYIFIAFFNIVTNAQSANKLTANETKEGWQLLFDGKSAKGWHTYLRDTVGSAWKINNGELQNDTSAPRNGHGDLVTNNEYENYIFSLEWKVAERSNSGIIFNVKEDPKFSQTYLTGLEMQVLDNIKASDNKSLSGFAI